MEFTESQIERYSRHILLPEIGAIGQQRLMDASVLVVGAGGLGAPVLLYLAAAGVGRIGIVDDDRVELSNLQRQVIHTTQSLGTAKTESARDRMTALNPEPRIETHALRLDASNVMDLIAPYDIIADGSDNFATRFLLNDACMLQRKTLVSGALLRFEGQVATWRGHEPHLPCYRCLFPAPPPPNLIPTCSEGGVLGAVAGLVGCLQATEILKEITGVGKGLAGRLMVIDALNAEIRTVRLRPDPACPLCGPSPTLTDLSHHG